MSVPERITVAITLTTANQLTAIARAHPIGSRTSIARQALELGLQILLKKYPIPPEPSRSASETLAAPLGPSGRP